MNRLGIVAIAGMVALAAAGAVAQSPAAPPAPLPSASAPAPDAATVAQPPVGPAPRIRFDAISLDLGDVPKGQDALAEFVFKNEGDAPLKILSAKPG